MNAAVWRYHPTKHTFEVFAWGTSNPWGVDFNDHGQAFITACVIPHLYHVIQGAHYQRQAGEHFNRYVYSDIKTIADHLHYAGSIGDHAWWGHEPGIQDDTSDAGGGHAHCGAMIYLGDNWPDRYRNHIFFNNIHGNRVNMDRLFRDGSGYVGKHGDDLMLSNDRWFRGINLRTGPDGSAYLIDWYDRNACHRVNPEIWDRTNGRVYNIAYGVPNRTTVDLAKLSDAELAKLAWHKNDWYVRVSRRLLQERVASGKFDGDSVAQEIEKLLGSSDETRVLRGLWLGHATGILDDEKLQALLAHPSAYAQAWAIQLLCEDRKVSQAVLSKLSQLASSNKTDALVRLYLASAINRIELDQRWEIAQGLLSHESDNKDRNIPLVAWYGIEPLVANDPKRALELASQSRIGLVSQYIVRRSAADSQGLEALVAQMTNWPAPKQIETLKQMLESMEGRVNVAQPENWKTAYEQLSKSDSPEIKDLALRAAVAFGDQRAFPQLRQRLVDKARPVAERKQALDILVKGRDKELAPSLYSVLDTPELQSPAIRALSAVADPQTAEKLLGLYSQLAKGAQEDAVATLVSRAPFAQKLFDAVESGKIARSDVHAFHVRQMVSLNDKELVERINQSWGKVGTSSQEQQQAIEKYKSQLPKKELAKADLSQGRLLFNKHCMACHQLFGAGEKVGPDLTGSNRADLNYILENLVAPNAVVGKDYQMTLLQLDDGRVLSGLITKETDSAVTLKTINDLVVVAKEEIDQRKLSDLSLMPNGLLEQMQPEEIRDLIGYLASPSQVPLRGPRPDFDSKGNVPAAIEGEAMKVLEKSRGTTQGQDMRAFPKDRWSANNHLWWTGGQPSDSLSLEFEIAQDGQYMPEMVLTKARDYAIVQLMIDQTPLGDPIDCFNTPEVITTGLIKFAPRQLAQGKHTLKIQIVGKHPEAVPGYMVGIDFLKFSRVEK
jgi:putative heme-binding domain-containing protein